MDGEKKKNIFCMDPPPLLDGCLGRELIITYRYTKLDGKIIWMLEGIIIKFIVRNSILYSKHTTTRQTNSVKVKILCHHDEGRSSSKKWTLNKASYNITSKNDVLV